MAKYVVEYDTNIQEDNTGQEPSTIVEAEIIKTIS